MSTLRESFDNSQTFPVWAGDYDALERLLLTIEAQFADLVPGYLEKETEYARQQVEYYRGQWEKYEGKLVDFHVEPKSGMPLSYWVGELDDAKRSLDQAELALRETHESALEQTLLSVSFETKRAGSRSIQGNSVDIVRHLRFRKFARATFKGPQLGFSGPRVTLTVDESDGVFLTVQADNSQWGTYAWTEIVRAISQDVPWWGFIRFRVFLSPLFLIAGLAWILPLALPLTADIEETSGLSDSLALGLVAGVPVAILILVGSFVIRKIIPAFDLVRNGSRARGSGAVILIGTTLLSIPVGVITNQVSG